MRNRLSALNGARLWVVPSVYKHSRLLLHMPVTCGKQCRPPPACAVTLVLFDTCLDQHSTFCGVCSLLRRVIGVVVGAGIELGLTVAA
mmetsp:Transcript_5868/g.12579  ORF Transcript_5868/g.12579 Transcript_5868/m.12579 type:complete len:88 (-) Transcript_5868:413-676(-)